MAVTGDVARLVDANELTTNLSCCNASNTDLNPLNDSVAKTNMGQFPSRIRVGSRPYDSESRLGMSTDDGLTDNEKPTGELAALRSQIRALESEVALLRR
ncbi:MAG: hypothetical protein CL520_07320, partial [Actinobacteria bacterium]|nr:hypothetical protein [Actinomycetota bacterium]